MKKILTIALFTICGISNAALNPSLSNALTQPFYDNSTAIATDSFVHTSIAASNASVVLSGLTGGTYNTASLGSGALLVYGSSSGVVTSIVTIAAAGTGYAVGDIIALAAGNHDAQILVTAVSSGGITAATPIYGGTGYAIYGGANAVSALLFFPDIVTFTGALTSNVTFVLPAMGRQLGSKQYIVNNNTTGAYTGTVCLTNGAGGTMGTCAVVPQGTANSVATLLETDGTTGIWLASQVAQTVSGSAQPNITSVGTLTGLTASADVSIHGITIGLGSGAISNNVAFGLNALPNNASGTATSAIGRNAGYSQTTGSYNTYIGQSSGYTATPANANITGNNNTWLGALSGPGTTAQLSNSTAIGYGALNLNSNEMVLGNSSLTSVTTAAAITAGGGFIGHASLDLPLTGGIVSGPLTVTGYSVLGYGVTQVAPSATAINTTASVNLGGFGSNGLFVGQYPSSLMTWMQASFINPTTATYHISMQPLGGYVGIGTGSTAPVSALQVNGAVSAGGSSIGASLGQFQASFGTGSTWYNAGFRNDGNNVYLLSSTVQTTQAAAANAAYNSLRPVSWNMASGAVTIDGTGVGTTFGGSLKHSQQEIDASYTYNTPTTGQTVTLASGTETAIINPSGALAALTVTLPSCTSGYDGSIARFGIEQIITALTVNTTSGSVVGAATASTVGQGQAYICRGALTTWFRIN